MKQNNKCCICGNQITDKKYTEKLWILAEHICKEIYDEDCENRELIFTALTDGFNCSDNKYTLYGTKLIEDDSTMRTFAESVIKNIDDSDIINDEDYEEIFMERVHDSIIDDISRTNINYAELMQKYTSEIGLLLCRMEDHGFDLQQLKISFYGEAAKEAFNTLIEELVWFIKFYTYN